MLFRETALPGVFEIDLQPIEDDRGFFARAYCAREFALRGMTQLVLQTNFSHNRSAGTIRGMHWMALPAQESKLVRCINGAIFDVVVDVRVDSPHRGQFVTVELSAARRNALYVPPGFAHGFQTLQDETEVMYQVGDFYEPSLDRGFRFDDPAVGIPWPLPVSIVSERDRGLPALG